MISNNLICNSPLECLADCVLTIVAPAESEIKSCDKKQGINRSFPFFHSVLFLKQPYCCFIVPEGGGTS